MASMAYQIKQMRYDLKKQYAKEQTDKDGNPLPVKNITTETRVRRFGECGIVG